MGFNWRNSQDVIDQFKKNVSENYQSVTVDCGITTVNPQKIIALQLDYGDIKDDYRMKKLKKNVRANGWNDPKPQDLALLQLPNGDLVVNGGGNHRALYSKELGLTSIKANLNKVIDFNSLPADVIEKINEIDKELNSLATKLNGNVDPQNEDEVNMFDKLQGFTFVRNALIYDNCQND